jgi:hypothetical protein
MRVRVRAEGIQVNVMSSDILRGDFIVCGNLQGKDGFADPFRFVLSRPTGEF